MEVLRKSKYKNIIFYIIQIENKILVEIIFKKDLFLSDYNLTDNKT